MATYRIVKDDAPYYTIDVSFADQTFRQQIIVKAKNKDAAFQAYADEYEASWLAAQEPVE